MGEQEAARAWVASKDVVSASVGDELALLDFKTNTYFTLNETGALIWSLFASPKSIEELCEAVSAQFEIDAHQCKEDVVELVSELISGGLIEAVDDSTQS